MAVRRARSPEELATAMPELPEVEVIAEYLRNEVVPKQVVSVEAPGRLVLRATLEELRSHLVDATIHEVGRYGKFLIIRLPDAEVLINFMLAGRLRHCPAGERRRKTECVIVGLDDSTELRYTDSKKMGRIYLARGGDYAHIPGYTDQGPDALDPKLDLGAFVGRLKSRRGQVKGVLRNQSFVAGLGTAYSDEILFSAGIFPFRRVSKLGSDEIDRLYTSMRSVLSKAIETLRARQGPLHEQDRSFMKVHGRAGEPCPACGKPISRITARGEITDFCASCQPRGRLGGLH
jgi:formamidopyrimidine-DNA glycosylase